MEINGKLKLQLAYKLTIYTVEAFDYSKDSLM